MESGMNGHQPRRRRTGCGSIRRCHRSVNIGRAARHCQNISASRTGTESSAYAKLIFGFAACKITGGFCGITSPHFHLKPEILTCLHCAQCLLSLWPPCSRSSADPRPSENGVFGAWICQVNLNFIFQFNGFAVDDIAKDISFFLSICCFCIRGRKFSQLGFSATSSSYI